MITPVQFEHKLAEIDLSALDKPKANAAGLDEIENQLRQLDEDINREIFVIRTQYQTRIDAANRGGTSKVMVSNRQSESGRHRVDEIARLEEERDGKLAPFNETKDKIVQVLEKIVAARAG